MLPFENGQKTSSRGDANALVGKPRTTQELL
jgi:hypothetical protein